MVRLTREEILLGFIERIDELIAAAAAVAVAARGSEIERIPISTVRTQIKASLRFTYAVTVDVRNKIL